MKYHIEDLRDQLHNHNWIVLKESEGNDLDISEYWTIRHRYQPNKTCNTFILNLNSFIIC